MARGKSTKPNASSTTRGPNGKASTGISKPRKVVDHRDITREIHARAGKSPGVLPSPSVTPGSVPRNTQANLTNGFQTWPMMQHGPFQMPMQNLQPNILPGHPQMHYTAASQASGVSSSGGFVLPPQGAYQSTYRDLTAASGGLQTGATPVWSLQSDSQKCTQPMNLPLNAGSPVTYVPTPSASLPTVENTLQPGMSPASALRSNICTDTPRIGAFRFDENMNGTKSTGQIDVHLNVDASTQRESAIRDTGTNGQHIAAREEMDREILEQLRRIERSIDRNTEATSKHTEAITRHADFLSVLDVQNKLSSSYTQFASIDKKPVVEAQRISDACRLTCGREDCEVNIRGQTDCVVAIVWSQTLTNRLPALKKRSGSPLGVYVSDMARDPSATMNAFYPSKEGVFRDIFTCVINNTSRLSAIDLNPSHVAGFFNTNKDRIISEVVTSFRNSHNTKKSEILKYYKKFCGSAGYMDYFSSSEAIDTGSYRSAAGSPVDKPAYVQAVKRVFGLTAATQADTAVRVGLHQLCFTNVVLIRSFENPNKGVTPALFDIVPHGVGNSGSDDSQREMVGLMVASMQKALENCVSATKTVDGWRTESFNIQDTSGTEDVVELQQKLGKRSV